MELLPDDSDIASLLFFESSSPFAKIITPQAITTPIDIMPIMKFIQPLILDMLFPVRSSEELTSSLNAIFLNLVQHNIHFHKFHSEYVQFSLKNTSRCGMKGKS